jgi:hypothetical protein
MVKNSGKHKRRFWQCNRRKAELYACWFSFQYMHLHVLWFYSRPLCASLMRAWDVVSEPDETKTN